MKINQQIIIIVTAFSIAGCTINPLDKVNNDSAPKNVPIDVMAVPSAVPKYEKRTRAGNPGEYKVFGKQYKVLAESKGYQKRGIASWYGTKFHGRKTANGEVYNMYAMTAAHKTLPIPSYVQVKNLNNQRSVVVRINDRGPFHQNRIIDLSYTAAMQLGIKQAGTGFVEVTALELDQVKKPAPIGKNSLPFQKNTQIFLQLGAFSDQKNARQLQEKLRIGQVENSRVLEENRQGRTIYKVQVGPLNSTAHVDAVNDKLNHLGLTDTQLIVGKIKY